MEKFDYDWIVIGSGFGGSVSALRLAEKGYRVAVLEQGRRFRDEDLPTSAWQVPRFFWMPQLGFKGLWKVTLFKDITVLSGCSVGGGSNNYAATLYRAPTPFFQHSQWRDLADWESRLKPHYDTAERMLGAVPVPFEAPNDAILKGIAEHLGCAHTFTRPLVGIYFGEPGKKVADPFFGGEGPARTGCTRCGSCMMGCSLGAKNTLTRNYLWLAEKRGVTVLPERVVTDVKPLADEDGAGGYVVTSARTGAWLSKDVQQLRAKGVVFAAGAMGTNALMASCKNAGSLPRVSPRLGKLVRTNSETLQAVTLPDDSRKTWNSISITGSIFPDANTHIEVATFGRTSDVMSVMYSLLTGPGTKLTRPLKALAAIARHPIWFAKKLWPFGWSARSVVVGCMQTLDNAISFRARPRLFGGGVSLQTERDPTRPLPSFFPAAQQATEWLAKTTGGVPQSFLPEALLSRGTTAHILGGAVIGAGPEQGVVNERQEVFGYKNLLVCDGSVIPANPGVNPSLTITAMAENAMSHLPRKGAA